MYDAFEESSALIPANIRKPRHMGKTAARGHLFLSRASRRPGGCESGSKMWYFAIASSPRISLFRRGFNANDGEQQKRVNRARQEDL